MTDLVAYRVFIDSLRSGESLTEIFYSFSDAAQFIELHSHSDFVSIRIFKFLDVKKGSRNGK